MILDIHNCHYPRSACPLGSPNCQLLLRHLVSHSHALDSPSSKFYIVCQVEPTTCISCCALLNSHPRAGCQFLRCRIRICVQAANVFAAEFLDNPSSRLPMPLTSFSAWLGHSIVKPMFVNNLRCRFSFDEPTAAQICAADFSHCWHDCQHP